MTPASWTYPPELLAALETLGIRPGPGTAPALVREAVNDLYRYELRRLRDRRRAGDVAQADYLAHVVALRKKYWMLTLQLPAWEQIATRADDGR